MGKDVRMEGLGKLVKGIQKVPFVRKVRESPPVVKEIRRSSMGSSFKRLRSNVVKDPTI